MLIDTRRRRCFGSAWFQNNNGFFTHFMVFGGSRRYSAINHYYSGGLSRLPCIQCGVFDHQTITHSLWPLSSASESRFILMRTSTAIRLHCYDIVHISLELVLVAGWLAVWWWWLMSKHYKFQCQLLNHLSS